jgi:hypothetical protein
LSKLSTSAPTKFTDPKDDYSTFPTFTAYDEPTTNPTAQKVVAPTGRPTRKPRSSIYDDQDSEEKVTSDSFADIMGLSIWTVGLLQLFVVL